MPLYGVQLYGHDLVFFSAVWREFRFGHLDAAGFTPSLENPPLIPLRAKPMFSMTAHTVITPEPHLSPS